MSFRIPCGDDKIVARQSRPASSQVQVPRKRAPSSSRSQQASQCFSVDQVHMPQPTPAAEGKHASTCSSRSQKAKTLPRNVTWATRHYLARQPCSGGPRPCGFWNPGGYPGSPTFKRSDVITMKCSSSIISSVSQAPNTNSFRFGTTSSADL